MKRIREFVACAFLLVQPLCGLCLAQPTLTGRVLDAVGSPVPGVELTLLSQGGAYASTISDDLGNYLFTSLRLGVNEIEASFPGFLNTTLEFKYDPRLSIELRIDVLLTIDVAYIARRGLSDDFDEDEVPKIALQVVDGEGSPVAGIEVFSPEGLSLGTSDDNGIILFSELGQKEGPLVFRFRKSGKVYEAEAKGSGDLLFTVRVPEMP